MLCRYTLNHALVILLFILGICSGGLEIRIYALSDPSNAEFRGSCDHLDNESYEQCFELHEVLCTIEDERSSTGKG